MYSTWKSAQRHVEAWMEGELGGEWIHVCVWLSPFAAHLKLSQYCSSAIPQYKIKSLKKIKINKGWMENSKNDWDMISH